MRIAVVCSSYYFDRVESSLLEGCREALLAEGVARGHISEIVVPGAFEIPLALQHAMETEHIAGGVALGCVIRGETTHYDIICAEVPRACMSLMLRRHTPIGFGVLTCETLVQAEARAGGEKGNRGAEAARALVSMLKSMRRWRE